MTAPVYLAPQGLTVQHLIEQTPLRPFNPQVLDFIKALSTQLLHSEQAKLHPELVALGFWLRKANMQALRAQAPQGLNKALGLVVHFTPANVDTMFIYSWVCALLMGNKNIVRVATRATEARAILLDILSDLLIREEFTVLAQRNLFVSYPKESSLSAELSLQADARVMWGGDESVQAIRALPTKPRARDISFADRYSAALIQADNLGSDQQLHQLAQLLWRDTEAYAQQACSSPRILFWLGGEQYLQALLDKLNELAKESANPVSRTNNHLVLSQLVKSQQACAHPYVLDAICALPVKQINQQILSWHSGAGAYFIYSLQTLAELADVAGDKLQTLSYWGVEKDALLKLAQEPSIQGIDRLVPVGQALDFSPVWDGFDLFVSLSRTVNIL